MDRLWDVYQHHPDLARAQEIFDRITAKLHAVQTGVGYMMEQGSKETHPKHLRVGINNALIQNSALQMLLVIKGIITPVEYAEAVEFLVEREVERYRREVASAMGVSPDNIILG